MAAWLRSGEIRLVYEDRTHSTQPFSLVLSLGALTTGPDAAPDAEPRDRLDAPRPRHDVRALDVPRDDVLVRVAELADAVVAPRVHVGPG